MLVIKQPQMPLSTEELLKAVESNTSAVMFEFRGHSAEQILRKNITDQPRFKLALEKYAPVPLLLLISSSWEKGVGF
jgi:hypothetical protein